MNTKKWKNFICCVIFIFIIGGGVFPSITYLFSNSEYDRFHITGIKEEAPLDMVYIGGSAAFVYWQPMKAWNDRGIASYSFATNGLPAESIKYYITETLKTQNPKLFVVDVRPFQYWSSGIDETGFRRGADSMDLSSNRMAFVHDTIKNRELPEETDLLSYYISFIKYHSNYTSVLSTPTNWSLINNKGISQYKGWEFINAHNFLVEPTNFLTTEKAELADGCLNALYNLLDYCKEKNLNILFVVCPYSITMEDKEKYNSLQNIIETQGFQFLDTNEHYSELNLDFTLDFYNRFHVNCFGAEKYTDFLENYIDEHYDFPDHRDENIYDSWDDVYNEFSREEINVKNSIKDMIQRKLIGVDAAENIVKEEDANTWNLFAGNENFVLLFATQGQWKNTALEYSLLMKEWGIDTRAENGKNYIKVIYRKQDTLLEEISDDYVEKSCTIGELGAFPWPSDVVLSSGETASIVIAGVEYALQENGVNAVVYDYNRNLVVDSVVISCNDDGKIVLRRKK